MICPVAISAAESGAFARLSGDFNPLHLDPLVARRSHFGGTVVHGIHAFLKVFDAWAASRERPFELQSARIKFNDAVPTGAPVAWEVSGDPGKLFLRLRCGSGLQQRNTLHYVEASGVCGWPKPLRWEPRPPDLVSFEASCGLAGSVDLGLDAALARELFPNLCRWMPPAQLAALLATTRIVGMKCPGLHSIFMTLDAQFSPAVDDSLAYRVIEADERYSMLSIGLRSQILNGSLQAMFRPAPALQESFAAIRERLRGDEFNGQRAVVIGGSRGLGELAAKLIAGGGGEAWITYLSGSADAERVAAEIGRGGGAARAFRFDVSQPPENVPPELAGAPAPTHIYFFATPPIRLNRSSVWDHSLFSGYCEFYVAGLERSVRAVRSWWAGTPLTVFYPSTAFLDRPEQGAVEYAAAKAAGESFCRYLEASASGVCCHVARLPRMLTDQTNVPGLEREIVSDSVSVILRALLTAHAIR